MFKTSVFGYIIIIFIIVVCLKIYQESDAFQLKWTETIDVLPRQHIIVFTKQPAEDDAEKPKQP